MTSFPYRPHLRNPHLSTPSPTEILTLHGEGIRRQTSHLNLDQEIFGHAPGIPTPPNVSPLSGTSFVGLLPRHASLLSPDDDPRTSSRSQLLLPGSSTTVRSTAPTISQPVQSGVPLRTEHECLPGNTTHRHQAQPKDTGPASGGRSVGLCGRLLRVFRAPFRALLCIPKRPAAEPPRHAPSSRRQSRDKVKNGGHVELRNTDRDSADGEKAIPTTTPNNRSAPIPPPLSSLHAFEVSLSKRGRLPVITSDGVGKEWVHTEAIIGTPEQQPSADLGSYMPTAQPNSLAPNSGFPCSDTSAGPPKTLYRERREQDLDHGHRDTDVDHSVSTGHGTVDFEPPQNVPGSDSEDGNGPPSRKTMSKHSFSTMAASSIDGNSNDDRNDGHRGYQSVDG